MFDVRTVEAGACCEQERDSADGAMSMTARRRRAFQRQACLLSVLAAFSLGLALGVFVPLIGISQAASKGSIVADGSPEQEPQQPALQALHHPAHQMPHFPTIDDIRSADDGPRGRYASVSFIAEEKLTGEGEDVLFHPKLEVDGFVERKLPSPAASIVQQMLAGSSKMAQAAVPERRESRASKFDDAEREDGEGVIRDGIYWGPSVERALPDGFDQRQSESWARYLHEAEVERLEIGCGRMQNRLLVFRDGTRACARYRQNTDQIQGELFSFYLGQLLNLTNLAPRLDRPRDGVRRLLLDRLGPARDGPAATPATPSSSTSTLPAQPPTPEVLERLVELAQWSDLIVFDYLIANLDRVVNNLYNFQWNADIMAAPAHNLARQTDSSLLVFLDNESGLLHGYRLLKKYEAYHGLLLDNLCVFRRSTVRALEALRDASVGQRLNALFERTTTAQIRDVLPPLPEKSVKILVDRIDRVLGQVQKCRETFADR
uniref:FAM20 C-terminal domain-containing protein n=1 Tax=Anopheles coluzzii TaxID=1518534 RepID=A0A8W7PES5_ANOCL